MNTCQVAIQLLILTSHFIYLQTANGAPSPSVDLPFISLEIANGAASTPPSPPRLLPVTAPAKKRWWKRQLHR